MGGITHFWPAVGSITIAIAVIDPAA